MARDALDNELTALVGESYNRAYGVSNRGIFRIVYNLRSFLSLGNCTSTSIV